MLNKLEAKAKEQNKLNASIRKYAPGGDAADAVTEADVAMAELRAMAMLQLGCFRPLQTYAQNHASQADMWAALDDYGALVEKLGKLLTVFIKCR
eukprot:SAG31_NODE_22513_length_524_cov_0.729412_1_plen_95_part_00